jgi:transposase
MGGTHNTIGPETPVPELLAIIAALTTRVESQTKQIAELTATITELTTAVADLTAQLNTNSHNSSKPPSTDGPATKPRSQRRHTGRKPGGQQGHKGSTLRTVEHPDRVETHRPDQCGRCGTSLEAAPAIKTDARQVFDLPEDIHLQVTEHHLETVACPHCGTRVKADGPPGVTRQAQYGPKVLALLAYLVVYHHLPVKRTAEAFAAILGAPLSPATVLKAVAEASGKITEHFEPVAKAALMAAAVAHVDETGFKVAGERLWVHSFSTKLWVWLAVHRKRGREAMDQIGILPNFKGVLVHDCWAPYDTYKQIAAHQLCAAHVIRELGGVQDHHAHQVGEWCWAGQVADGFRAVIGDPATVGSSRHQIASAVACVSTLDPEAYPGSKQAMKHAALVKRLTERIGDYLYFTTPEGLAAGVEPTNNPAEREVRMVKIKQKTAGCMRTVKGAQQFLSIRSYIATAVKHGVAPLTVLASLTSPNPWLPATP